MTLGFSALLRQGTPRIASSRLAERIMVTSGTAAFEEGLHTADFKEICSSAPTAGGATTPCLSKV